MNQRDQRILRGISKKLDNKKPVKVGDAFGTIIYIDEHESEDLAIKKYLKDLEDYRLSSIMNPNTKKK